MERPPSVAACAEDESLGASEIFGGRYRSLRVAETAETGLFREFHVAEKAETGLFRESHVAEKAETGLFREFHVAEKAETGLFRELHVAEKAETGLFQSFPVTKNSGNRPASLFATPTLDGKSGSWPEVVTSIRALSTTLEEESSFWAEKR